MQTWRLFVDESGRLDGDQDSVVGGILGPQDFLADERLDGQLDAIRHQVFPPMPHPPHQTEINIPTSFLAWWMYTDSDHRHACPRPLQGQMVALSRGVRGADNPVTKAFVAAIEAQKAEWRVGRRRVVVEPTRALDELLRGCARRSHGWLQSRTEAWNQQMRALFEQLGGQGAVGLLGFELGRTPAPGEHYRHAFQAMVHRAALVCTAGSRSARLEIVAASRQVEHEGGREESSTDLLQRWAQHAVSVTGRAVDVQVQSVQRYDHRIASGLVLADFIANRARHIATERSWHGQQEVWRYRTRLRATSSGLPTFECVGSPYEAICDELGGREPTVPGQEWRWARGETQAALHALRQEAG